jgi:hypothetical protein
MSDEAAGEGATAQVAATETKVVGKKSQKAASGDMIVTIAQEVEKLNKTKALSLADTLATDVETNYFKLGGVLKVINENSWFEGYESFDIFVFERFGFQSRKARYLISIYTELVEKQIPWDKVGPLGWTKVKDLAVAGVLTPENVDEWVEKAKGLTVLELQNLLKGGNAETQTSSKTTDDVTALKFKLKNDQLETVQSALNKAKAETATEFDNVALENICAGYLGGVIGAPVSPPKDPVDAIRDLMKDLGYEQTLNIFGEIFPEINLTAEIPE